MNKTRLVILFLGLTLLLSGCVTRTIYNDPSEKATKSSSQSASIIMPQEPPSAQEEDPHITTDEIVDATDETAHREAPAPTESPLRPVPDIIISKHPNDDRGIIEGNTQISIARSENADLVHWQIASPDESAIYTDTELESAFPVKVYKIDAETLWIVSIPLEMDGYKVRAVFEKDGYEAYSDWATIHVIGFFTQIPHEYTFSSGAGAWSTELHLENDGSFTGYFHDWDAYGPNGEQGYIAECRFSGHFGHIGKIDDKIYTMELLDLKQEGTVGEKYVDADGMTHETSTPYGFDNASLFYIYVPGISVDKLQEGFVNWAQLYGINNDTFDWYGIYNYYGEQGFIQVS